MEYIYVLEYAILEENPEIQIPIILAYEEVCTRGNHRYCLV